MATNERNMVMALVVVIVIILLWWAREHCKWPFHGRFAKKGCLRKIDGFCTADGKCSTLPDPAAASEAMGLYELGVRMSEKFCGGASGTCGSMPAPAALAEYEGLRQMGWRPEHMRTRPTCARPAPAAVSEAQSLQHAQALRPGSPYYTVREGFGGRSGCGGVSSEAVGETHLLDALQALPEDEGVDGFAAHKLTRDQAARASAQHRSEALRSNPAQVSAPTARMNSMREGFGGPDQAGFGWTPTPADVAASPTTGGWGDAQSVGAAACFGPCMDGCNGTHCEDHCKDQCRTQALRAATDVV